MTAPALPILLASARTVDPGNLGVALGAVLILLNGVISLKYGLGLGKNLIIGSLRMTAQLTVMGLILSHVFELNRWYITVPLLVVMVIFGGVIAGRSTKRRFRGIMWVSIQAELLMAFFISAYTLYVIMRIQMKDGVGWVDPVMVIPIVGMLAGNCLNGISLALDRLTTGVWERRGEVEAILSAGGTSREACYDIAVDAIRGSMLPTINNMAAIGIVFMPGMMTGQILAGADPMVAVRYQIVIMFALAAGRALGAILAVALGVRHLFDDRQRLRLDWLTQKTAKG